MNIFALQRRFSPLLHPIAAAYGAAMRLRAGRYREGVNIYRAACSVVSIGNISWGGSGKTPVIEYLLGKTKGAGLRTAVLTRGYKATPPQLPFPVMPDSDPTFAGDEPLMLALRHPETLVVVDPKRSRSASWVEKNDFPQLFLLDDGMQHLSMARDLDIVLLKPNDLLTGWNRVIPTGEWREDKSALTRADSFCVKASGAEQTALITAAQTRLEALERPLFFFDLLPNGLSRLVPPGGVPLDKIHDLGGAAYTFLCGTGNPDHVRQTVKSLLGKEPTYAHILPDHYRYTAADAQAVRQKNLPVVCTAKDAVKLSPLLPIFGDLPVWVLEVEAVFNRTLFSDTSFDVWWETKLARLLAVQSISKNNVQKPDGTANLF